MISLRDKNGNYYKAKDKSRAELWLLDDNNAPEFFDIKRNSTSAKDGIYTFENLEITLAPGTTVLVKLKLLNFLPDAYESEAEYDDYIGFINGKEPEIYSLTARPCEEGEAFTRDYKCIACPRVNHYSFIPLTEPG